MAIPIDRIDFGGHRRALFRPAVKALAASMAEIGLLCPISVHPVGDAYELVAGRHRIEAARSLGWTEIPAVLVDLDAVQRELAEIDENLVRQNLNALELARQTARRKELYLKLHPETAAGAKRAAGMNKALGRGNVGEIISPTFAADTAEKTGRTARAVQQDVQIAESIANDVADAIRDTPLADSKTDLLAMARLPQEDQREIVATVDLTDKSSVRTEIARRRPCPAPAPRTETTEVEATVEGFARAIANLLDVESRRRLIALIAADIKRAAISGN